MRSAQAVLSPAPADQVFTLNAGGGTWAVPAEAVQTVFRVGVVTPVPLAPAVIAGLLNFRGRVIVAIDLALRVGADSGSNGRYHGAYAVAVEHGSEVFALLVDAVGDVLPLTPEMRVEPPAHLAADLARLTRVWFRMDNTLLPLLDLARVLTVDAERRSGHDRRVAAPTDTGAKP